jgi:hypothetical protein
MPNAALGRELVGQVLHLIDRAAQNGDFEARFVIKMNMRGGDAEIVVVVLGGNEAL